MSRTSLVGPICGCAECHEYGVQDEPQRRVPAVSTQSGARWIHGRELAMWLQSKRQCLESLRRAVGAPGRRGQMERLVLPQETAR
jgi:hypothetical protein